MNPSSPVSATSPATRPVQTGWWAHAWDRLSIYLPVLLMGLLALASYWVLRHAPQAEVAPPVRSGPEGPDYVMRDFAVRSYFADGRLKSEIFGLEARHFPARGELEIEQVRLRSMDELGRLTRAEALRAVTDDAQAQYHLEGQVLLVREPAPGDDSRRLTFQGQQLQVDTVAGTIASDQPVTVLHGPDRLQADRLRYQDSERTATFQGRVKATLVARP